MNRLTPLLAALLLLAATTTHAGDLETLHSCTLVPTGHADGDSFQVLLPDQSIATIRLYAVDCIETSAYDETTARRLRTQRRHFGIGGSDPAASIQQARTFGQQAAERTRTLLAEPFTVHTAHADAMGRSSRIYAFVTTSDGRDLATTLVREGLARAYGISRTLPDGTPSSEYKQHLADLEFAAAANRRGIWASTDWDQLPADRAEERRESRELRAIIAPPTPTTPLDPNTATAEELATLPGIGPVLAGRIVASRATSPIRTLDDLDAIPGISPRLLATIAQDLDLPGK
jgi:competence protein ComEA